MTLDKGIKIAAVLLGLLVLSRPTNSVEAAPKDPPIREFKTLKAGRYACKIEGMLCRTCAKILEAEIKKIPSVVKVSADFESRELRLEVKEDSSLAVKTLKKTLKRATKRNNLVIFRILSIRHLP